MLPTFTLIFKWKYFWDTVLIRPHRSKLIGVVVCEFIMDHVLGHSSLAQRGESIVLWWAKMQLLAAQTRFSLEWGIRCLIVGTEAQTNTEKAEGRQSGRRRGDWEDVKSWCRNWVSRKQELEHTGKTVRWLMNWDSNFYRVAVIPAVPGTTRQLGS